MSSIFHFNFLLAMKVVASRICKTKQEKQINFLLLSNNTMKLRIVDIRKNLEETVVAHLNSWHYFALQVDECTDLSDNTNLMFIVRYDFDNTIHKEFFFFKPLIIRTTAEEIFNFINKYIPNRK